MKLINDQRRLYMLAAALVLLSAMLLCTWRLWGAPDEEAEIEATLSPTGARQTLIPLSTPAATGEAPESTQTASVRTVVYYQDNYGYLVPVTKAIPDQPGVAKATLAMMSASPQNDMEAARLGLRTVLPEGTTVDIDIAGGVARVDLGGAIGELADAAAESNMITAVVQTLTEFPTVEKVRFLIDGKSVAKLKYGTEVSGDFSRGLINIESASLEPGASKAVTLYFPGETGSLIVPVTRMVYGSADVNTAVMELVKGPGPSSPLDSILPGDCALIGVTVENGVAYVNFTKEFINIAEQSDGGRQALRALALTCAQFPGIDGVEILVEGEPYDTGEDTLAIPTFVNDAEAVYDQFLQTQASLLFEDEID